MRPLNKYKIYKPVAYVIQKGRKWLCGICRSAYDKEIAAHQCLNTCNHKVQNEEPMTYRKSFLRRGTFYRQIHQPLHRVIKQGQHWLCGVCRSAHDYRDEAHDCMSVCWSRIKEEYPLTYRRVLGQGCFYRCRFCSRDYKTEEKGLKCAKDCKNKISLMIEEEVKISQSSSSGNRKKSIPKGMNINKLRSKLIPKYVLKPGRKSTEYGIDDQLEDEIHTLENLDSDNRRTSPNLSKNSSKDNSHRQERNNASDVLNNMNQLENDASTEEIQNQRADEAATNRRRRKKSDFGGKEFSRHDAKYVCAVCLDPFWTKLEVEGCFKKHFDEDGNEIFKDEVESSNESDNSEDSEEI